MGDTLVFLNTVFVRFYSLTWLLQPRDTLTIWGDSSWTLPSWNGRALCCLIAFCSSHCVALTSVMVGSWYDFIHENCSISLLSMHRQPLTIVSLGPLWLSSCYNELHDCLANQVQAAVTKGGCVHTTSSVSGTGLKCPSSMSDLYLSTFICKKASNLSKKVQSPLSKNSLY